MSMEIGTNTLFETTKASYQANSTSNLETKLNADTNKYTDTELLDACKGFESYLVEQVFKEMKKTVPKGEGSNEYTDYFEDSLYQEYTKNICENSELGIAKMLYDSMKRNQ